MHGQTADVENGASRAEEVDVFKINNERDGRPLSNSNSVKTAAKYRNVCVENSDETPRLSKGAICGKCDSVEALSVIIRNVRPYSDGR